MSIIEWGQERECTGDQPCPDWVYVQIVSNHGTLITHRASVVAWQNKFRYKLPAEYEALIAAREPTHEQMRETLAARYEGMPNVLAEIDPVKAAYQASGKVRDCDWEYLNGEWHDAFRAMFKAGQEHDKKSLD